MIDANESALYKHLEKQESDVREYASMMDELDDALMPLYEEMKQLHDSIAKKYRFDSKLSEWVDEQQKENYSNSRKLKQGLLKCGAELL